MGFRIFCVQWNVPLQNIDDLMVTSLAVFFGKVEHAKILNGK